MFARPGFPSFDYVRAGTLDEAVGLLEEHGNAARLLMGGTDLFPGLRNGVYRPQMVIDVKHVPGMGDIRFDREAGLTVGSAVTMNELACHADVQAHYPLLAEAATTVASYQIRNRATLGGNLCNASPCADTAPAVLVLEGRIVLYGPTGERSMPVDRFFVGPGQTGMQGSELMTAIRFPLPPADAASCYLKLGRLKAGDLALVGVAVLGYRNGMADSGDQFSTGQRHAFRIGLGSVAPTPLRARAAEALLAAEPPGKQAFVLAAKEAMAAASPITDVRGSADYQRAMVRTLTLRGLREVWEQLSTP